MTVMTTPVPFDENFLGPTTPMPSRPGLIELPYMHFTVSMDPNRRLAAVTAVNIDGSRLRAVARGDNWRLDDRLPADQQAGPELYSNNDLDRGHLVRRRDPVWGPQEVAERANSDTFHYTVCAPQTSTLNQSMTLWLGLEDYVLEHARQYGQLLSVFTGCIFAGEDPISRDVAIPRQFYKIAAWAQGEELAATGYVLDQTPSLDPIVEPSISVTDVPPLGPYRTFQVPIEDIASATALELAELVAADRYAPIASAAGAEDRWTELAEFDAIVL
jgi:endonuclease G